MTLTKNMRSDKKIFKLCTKILEDKKVDLDKFVHGLSFRNLARTNDMREKCNSICLQ